MTRLLSLYDAAVLRLEGAAPWLIPSLARLVFAGVLLVYYLNSGLSKFGEGVLGLFRPDAGAYVTIFPKAMEAVSYDISQLGVFHWAVTLAGTWAEVLLPVAIVIGLFTRLASAAMIGFVLVQSVVDVHGHGVSGGDIGAWFDVSSDALLLDQRAFWIFALGVLVLRGAGPISVDRALTALRSPSAAPA
ncbi:DoxX family membrane protein [Oceanicola sp. D3]|uniref:DoxX family protein n=1 Tax=Oceanicola sp. D3 TaxID=2587163 RepID=UPI00111E1FC0|nr:DoxX family membrane protein [Oceanicola sp. D3]QDC09052.1 DoxX family membrane protein [Oceanicola sp. D3]